MRDYTGWKPRVDPPRGLVMPVAVDPTGLAGPTRGQARGPKWRQTSRGYYVPATVDPAVPEQRILEAAVLLGEHGAVTGWASLRWCGAGYLDGLDLDGQLAVPIALGVTGDVRGRRGIRLSRDRLDLNDVVRVRGLRCTRPERAVFDEMRWAPDVRTATVAMDMAAAAELTSIRRVRAYAQDRPRWRGVPQLRAALDLADEGSRSPAETIMRLIWVLDAGFPAPLTNQPVFDARGGFIGVPDLLDPVAGVVGEYDGAAHRDVGRHRRDVERLDLFRRAGLEYFAIVGVDLLDTALVVDRMRATRRRALFLPPGERAWTLDAPERWYDSPLDNATLDERLDYSEHLRALAEAAC